MAESLRSTYDFIKSAFPVHVGVLTSQDAEIISQRNNLSFSELIYPFCTLTSEAQMHGIGSQAYRVYNMHVHVSDIRRHSLSIEKMSTRQHIADLVLKSGENETPQMVTVPCGHQDLSVNRTCPWMETYRDLILRYGPPLEHEYLSCFVACMLVVSSLHPHPMQEFGNLSQLQNRIQHGDGGGCKWMTPNTLKYFVLLHDVQRGDSNKAKEVLSSLQSTYGGKVCYLLQINSRSVPASESGEAMPSPWHQFMNYSAAFLGDEREEVTQSERTSTAGSQDKEHPPMAKDNKNPLENRFGGCLTMADHNSLQCFVQGFITAALLPYLEKTIKNINEQLSAKKGLHKSLFRATRTLFGSNKTSNLSGSSEYNRDASELLSRKVADLCFLSQMYEQAFHLYHTAKRDYTNDQAWLYVAGASEMAAISNFMQRNSQKNYPSHYMEAAINSYLDVCKNDYLALRCTLVHAECLQLLGLQQDAAYYLVKATSEVDDLRSALLLEQAAHCYLKMREPKPKKFAFQLVLAGHRFSKCGQRVHALRCYGMALQVYLGQDWKLAEDHINLAIARQSSSMKRLDQASDFFRKLLVQESYQSEVQQATMFREFIHIFQQCVSVKSGVNYAKLGLPQLVNGETVVYREDVKKQTLNFNVILNMNAKISRLENILLNSEAASRSDMVGATSCFCKYIANDKGPQLAIGEQVLVEVTFKNYLSTPVCLFDIVLLWDFVPLKDCQNEKLLDESVDAVRCDPLDQLWISKLEEKKVLFDVTPLKPGQVTASGVCYRVGQSSNTEPKTDKKLESSYSVLDYQPFDIVGRRLNRTKEEKMTLLYDSDLRLNFQVYPTLPKFTAAFEKFPSEMACNEVITTSLVVTNTGSIQLDILKIISCDKLQFTLTDNSGNDYFLPNVPACADQDIQKTGSFPSLLTNPLLAGEMAKFKACLKAPNYAGSCKADVLLYCKSHNLSAPSGRALFVQNSVNCVEGVSVQVDVVTPLARNNFVVSVIAKNVRTEQEPLHLEDVTCLSSDYVIKPVYKMELPGLMRDTDLFRYLRIEKIFEDPPVQDPNTEVAAINTGVQDSELRSQTRCSEIAVTWNCKHGSETMHIEGHYPLNLKKILSNPDTFTIPYHDLAKEDNTAFSLQTLHNMVSWKLVYEPIRHHDFVTNRLCRVNVVLRVFNMSNLELLINISVPQLGNRSRRLSNADFAWVGPNELKRSIAAHGESEIPLKACFVRHGIFKLSGISVTALPSRMGKNELPIPQKPLCGYFINVTHEKSDV